MGKGKRNRQRNQSAPEPKRPSQAGAQPWPSPREDRGGDPSWRTATAGAPVPVRYDGAPLSIWQAAWLYAETICELSDQRRRKGTPSTGAVERVVLARAITCAADQAGLDAMAAEMVDRPDALAAVSLPQLYLHNLHEITSITEFSRPTLGRVPQPAEPGYAAYEQLTGLVRADVTPEAALADPELLRHMTSAAETWNTHREQAQAAVLAAITSVGVDPETTPDIPLSLIGDRVNDHLSRAYTGS